mgnify:CR=1 FL=1
MVPNIITWQRSLNILSKSKNNPIPLIFVQGDTINLVSPLKCGSDDDIDGKKK